MQKSRLGNTNLFLSRISFGSGPFAGGYGDTPQELANAAVKKALESGINFFDTAPFYSSAKARSEEMLGIALKGVQRNTFIINTKCGRDRVGDDFLYDYTAAGVRKSFEKSLKRLQLDHLDMFTLHDVEFADSIDQIVNDALPELRRIQKEGKARYIGISGYPLDVLLAVATRFPVDFVLTYSHYSLQNELLADYIPHFQKLGCGVLNAAPLLLSFFTKQGPPRSHYAPPEMLALSPKISKMCEEKGLDVAHLAIKYAVHAPLAKSGQVATTLVGIARPNEVEVMLKTLEPLTEKEKEAISKTKEMFGPKWLNYTWQEKRSNQEKLLKSVGYKPPQKIAKL